MHKRGVAAFAAMTLGSTSLAYATPLIVDQQRVDQAQPPAPVDGLRGLTDEQPAPALNVARPSPPSVSPPPAQNVALRSVRISGSSLPAATFDSAWRDKIGATLDETAITTISNKLAEIYQRSDIALYSIITPAQDFHGGALNVTVVEGHVANVIIQTDESNAPDIRLARRYAEQLTHEIPLRRSTLERVMSLIRDIPGERVEASLAPVAETGGAALTLAARRNRADVGVSFSNRGTPLLGRTQASVDVSVNGMLRGGDHADLAVTAPIDHDTFQYVALAYATPIGAHGATITGTISDMHTQPRGVDVRGDAVAGGVSFSYPLLRSFSRSFIASVGVDALDTENATLGQVVDTSRTRAFRAGLTYADGTPTTSRSATLFASFGIDAFGARVDPNFADADFAKLALQAGWSHLYGEHLALRLSGQAQLTSSALPAAEQFALGGDTYGRAFASAIIQGDQGSAASLETAFIAPAAWLPSYLQGSEAYLYLDAGEVRLNDRPLFNGGDASVSSGGIGARLALWRQFTLSAELARAIDAPSGVNEDDWRLVYTLVGRR